MSKMKKEIIRMENVSFSYDKSYVLKDVTLSFYENEMVSIIGPNGSGKTTLLKLILGLIRPDRGHITVFSQSPEHNEHTTGYVPQYAIFDPEFPVAVIDVVLMGRLGLSGGLFYRKKDRQAAHEALEKVNLRDFGPRRFSSLSGGQRQRVLIARALASSPRLLLLDEPTAHVDRSTEQQLYCLIKDISRDITVLLVSHDLGVVPKISDRIACVNQSVKIHASKELTGNDIQTIYNYDINLVEHSRECEELMS
ncbi:MAG: ABC transporter ATP-binding protein [Spirochaetales bacterium]|nr:ABC transporter ATP-binding protein [Spirochaetales bacterium]